MMQRREAGLAKVAASFQTILDARMHGPFWPPFKFPAVRACAVDAIPMRRLGPR